MATNLLPFRSSVVITAAIPDAGKVSENSRRGTSSSGNWWGPLFAVSSEPDYIDSSAAVSQSSEKKSTQRFAPGSFTDEKAKRLRMLTKDSAFHDVMYHSAIASRLASEFKDRSDV